MSFDFFFKACKFWAKNLQTCNTCTNRTKSNSNFGSLSRNSELYEHNLSINSDIAFSQNKQTPSTQILMNNLSPTSSKQERSNQSSLDQMNLTSKNYKFSGNQKGRIWSHEEDTLLLNSFKQHEGKNWKSIAKLVSGRSATQCSQRWRRIQPYKARQPWTKDEDKLILSLIDKYGSNWCLIASMIEGRTGKQVRERFLNKLDKNINRAKFSEEDDDHIIDLYEKIGPKWKEISFNFKGRPENMIKNRFYSHIRKKLLLNPKKYKNILNNINNDNEMMSSINTVAFNQEFQDPKQSLNEIINEENDQIYISGEQDFENLLKNEEENQMLFEYFPNNLNNLNENQNFEFQPLTPNYIQENLFDGKTSDHHNLLFDQVHPSLSEIEIEKKPQDIIEFSESNQNNLSNSCHEICNENKYELKTRQMEFLNRKQEFLELMRNEVKEKIKNQISNS